MPHIVRPSPNSTITSAWGSLVADAVVMRFATAAQRAAQLVAPVVGQLTELENRLGTLQYWSGSAWADAAPFTQAGVASLTTNAAGDGSVVYPAPYASVPTLCLTALTLGPSTVPITVSVNGDNTGVAGFAFRCARGTTLLASTPVNIYWIAVGTRSGPA